MTTDEADALLDQIADIAARIELDDELRRADPRYAITAGWIDTDIEHCDPDA